MRTRPQCELPRVTQRDSSQVWLQLTQAQQAGLPRLKPHTAFVSQVRSQTNSEKRVFLSLSPHERRAVTLWVPWTG